MELNLMFFFLYFALGKGHHIMQLVLQPKSSLMLQKEKEDNCTEMPILVIITR
jgi:hypothetical protein